VEQPQALSPRCGYDLEGLIASWAMSCPMRAVCSECGLDFDCGRVLSAQLFGPMWSYEHSAQRSAARWWATGTTTLNPWRMCRELEVDHVIRPGRLVWFTIQWLIICHFLLAAIVMFLGNSPGRVFAPPGISSVLKACDELPDPLNRWAQPLVFPAGCDIRIGTGAFWASTSIPIMPIVALVFMPWVLMPLWTVLLDATFRIARVRRVHLLRALAYSLPGAATWFFLMLGYFIIVTATTGSRTWDKPRAAALFIFSLYLAYHVAWWRQFIDRYLRLRHGAAIVGLHFFMTLLALTAAGAMFFAGRLL
jgi:hypothetical protein